MKPEKRNNPFKKKDDNNTSPKKKVPQKKFEAPATVSRQPLSEEMRLNKFIAHAGVCSRRDADSIIAEGRIKVNNNVVTELGYKVQPDDHVHLDGKPLHVQRFIYLLLNKPKDYITTMEDTHDRKTVMEIIGDACSERIFPVGRLDRNTTGLLLFTNDGDLAGKLSHPSSQVKKVYEVTLDKPIEEEHFLAIQKGIKLEDGPVKVNSIAIISPDQYVLGVEIHIGKNRIVRRIFEHFGYEVDRLDRTTYAGLTKKNLARGKWRMLDEKEVSFLKTIKSKK